MTYVFMNYENYNSKYKNILKLAVSNSDSFSFFTVKQIHKKDHSKRYFDYLTEFSDYKISSDEIKMPRYTTGQQIHCYKINIDTVKLLNEPSNFSSWNAYDYPEDLVFYKNSIPWFRCISHERMVLVNDTNPAALDELKRLGINYKAIKDTNNI